MKRGRQFRELLAKGRLKRTSQRTLIWDLVLGSRDHPSAEEIRDKLMGQGHRVGLATIYRTLKILLDSGLVRQSKLGGMTRYEAVLKQPNHLHFVCNRCGSNVEFPSRRIESLVKSVTAEHSFEERYSRYVIFGLCRTCASKEQADLGLDEEARRQKILVRDALELTLAIERRGYSFYTHASRKTNDAGGRLMFQQLAAGESEHLRRARQEYERLLAENQWLKREPARLPITRKIAAEFFSSKPLHATEVRERTSGREALDIAIDIERRSHDFFHEFSEQLTDQRSREIFARFAREEAEHLAGLLEEVNVRFSTN